MKIRKFYESNEIVDISNDRVVEILDHLTSISSLFDKKKEELISLTNELSNYRSQSKKSNDQIDDSVSDMETITSKIQEVISSLDNISTNLQSYNDSGRKYLY